MVAAPAGDDGGQCRPGVPARVRGAGGGHRHADSGAQPRRARPVRAGVRRLVRLRRGGDGRVRHLVRRARATPGHVARGRLVRRRPGGGRCRHDHGGAGRRAGGAGLRIRTGLGGALRGRRPGVPGAVAASDLRRVRRGVGGAVARRSGAGRTDRGTPGLAVGVPRGAGGGDPGGAAGPAGSAGADRHRGDPAAGGCPGPDRLGLRGGGERRTAALRGAAARRARRRPDRRGAGRAVRLRAAPAADRFPARGAGTADGDRPARAGVGGVRGRRGGDPADAVPGARFLAHRRRPGADRRGAVLVGRLVDPGADPLTPLGGDAAPGPGWPASRSVRRAWRRRWCPDCRCCRPC